MLRVTLGYNLTLTLTLTRPRASGLAARLALLWRALKVLSTFWLLVGH